MKSFLSFALLMLTCACSAQTTQIGIAPNPVTSLNVASPSLQVGGTFQFSAITQLSDLTNSVPALGCVWTSSAPSVATINGNGLATAVSPGTTTITCTTPSGLSGTGQLTVSATPTITSPICGTPPCPLTAGLNGVSYSYTLTATGGVLPYTWTCPTTCAMPGWMSLNSSTGVLSGTGATGSTTFGIKVCDSTGGTPLCATLSVSITVTGSSACVPPNYAGPPTYPCASTSSANPGNIIFLFSSGTPEGKVNTSNAAIAPCTANCMQYVSGDPFVTSWNTGNGGGNGGNIEIGGGVGTASTLNGASGLCPANCVLWSSGDTFNAAWTSINLSGVAFTVGTVYSSTLLSVTHAPGTTGTASGFSVVGTKFGVSTWNSTTVATLMTSPGTQSGVVYLNHTACKAGSANVSGNGCQNSVSEDTTIPGHVSGSNLITRMTDGSVLNFGKSIGNMTLSGGDNDFLFSYPTGTYLWAETGGGAVQPLQVSTAGHNVQVVNAGCVPQSLGPLAFHTSWLNDANFYYVAEGANSLQIKKGTLTGSGCSLAFTSTTVVDYFSSGVCPGITAFTPKWLSILGVSDNDDIISISSSPNAAQGTADWIFHYKVSTGQCATENMNTGQWWAYCSSSCSPSTPAGGTFSTASTSCWGSNGSTGNGIHDMQSSGDGLWVVPSRGTWTQGGCAGLPSTGSGTGTIVGIGNGINNWCTAAQLCGGHNSVGLSKMLAQNFQFDTIRALNNPAGETNFHAGLSVQQLHQSWPHNCSGTYDDTCAWIGASGEMLASEPTCSGGLGTSPVYCPGYLENQVLIEFPFATYPPGLVAVTNHAGICGKAGTTYAQCTDNIPDAFGGESPIGIASPKGDMYCWASSNWHQGGFDQFMLPRIDILCTYLGHP